MLFQYLSETIPTWILDTEIDNCSLYGIMSHYQETNWLKLTVQQIQIRDKWDVEKTTDL